MALGGTARKIQKIAEMAEDVYARLNEMRDQVKELRVTVGETNERVGRLEAESAEQRALLEALARERGLDTEAITAEAHIREAEADADAEAANETGDRERGTGGVDENEGAAADDETGSTADR